MAEILIAFGMAIIITFMCVYFYTLGLSHGKMIKNGAEVKLEPRKAIARTVAKHKEHKEVERKQDEFTKQVNELFAYDGRVKKVAK